MYSAPGRYSAVIHVVKWHKVDSKLQSVLLRMGLAARKSTHAETKIDIDVSAPGHLIRALELVLLHKNVFSPATSIYGHDLKAYIFCPPENYN